MASRDDANDPDDRAALDALRQRVYGPHATDEDRARLRAVAAGAPPATGAGPASRSHAPEAAPDAAPAPRRRASPARLLLLIGGAVALVVAAALIGSATGLLRAPGPAPTPASALAVTGEERGVLIDNLLAGGAAGLSAYLVTHPAPPGLANGSRYDTVEDKGVGPRTLRVARPAEAGLGRASVLLVLASGGDAAWRVERTTSLAPTAPVIARRGGRQEAGVPTIATFALPPALTTVRLHVDAPEGVRWGVAVVFSERAPRTAAPTPDAP